MAKGNKSKRRAAQKRHVSAGEFLEEFWRQSLEAAEQVSSNLLDGSRQSLEGTDSSQSAASHAGVRDNLTLQGSKTGSFLAEFHCHSTCSDGSFSPAQVVRRAASRGVRILALTDHDSMTGVAEAAAAGREVGLCVIPGVEISAYYDCNAHSEGKEGCEEERRGSEARDGQGGSREAHVSGAGNVGEGGGVRGGVGAGGPGVHVLGYFPPLGMRERWERVRRRGEGEERKEDEDERAEGGEQNHSNERSQSEDGFGRLLEVLESIREGRHKRAAGMVLKLQQLGVNVTMADVIQQLDDPKTAPGRVHVARALVAVGAVGAMEEAFQRYIGDHGPAYVRGSEIPVSEAIRVIRQAGGAAVLAHPWTIPESALRGMLKRVGGGEEGGLVGMEVYRGKEIQEDYARLANAHNLLKIGGSDFHGLAKLAKRDVVDLGGCELPPLSVQRFVEAAGMRWRA